MQNIMSEMLYAKVNAETSSSKYRDFVPKRYAQNIDFMLKHHA